MDWMDMKKLLDFFKLILLCLWALFLRIYKVPAVILLFLPVSFLVGIFISPTLMVLMWSLGILGVSLFLFIPRCKQTAADINIIRKGERYNGNCLGMSRQYRSASTLFVEWTDSDNTKHKRSFYAIDNRSKYPHSVNVYSYNNDPEQSGVADADRGYRLYADIPALCCPFRLSELCSDTRDHTKWDQ